MKKHLLSTLSHSELSTAVSELEVVMRLAPDSTENARDIVSKKLSDAISVLNEFKPESFRTIDSYNHICHLNQHLTEAYGTLLDYRLNSLSGLKKVPEFGVSDNAAKQLRVFESKYKDIAVEEYITTKQDYQEDIEYFDKAMRHMESSPEHFISSDMSRQRRILRAIAGDFSRVSEYAPTLECNLNNPEGNLPRILAQYEYVRETVINEMGLNELARPEGFNDDNLLRNKSNIVSTLKHLDEVFAGIEEKINSFSNYKYGDTGEQTEQLRYTLEGTWPILGMAIGNNSIISPQVKEFKEALETLRDTFFDIETGCADLKYAMGEIEKLSPVGISDQALYDDSNTNWYISHFDEGSDKCELAKSIVEGNRQFQQSLNLNLDIAGTQSNNLSSVFATLKEAVISEIKVQSARKEKALEM